MQLSRSFTRGEFKCQCGKCDYDTVDAELVMVLQGVRDHFGASVFVTSGNRCVEHNRNIGGSSNSYHVRGRAADIQVRGYSPAIVQNYLLDTYPDKYGIGKYDNFTHIDTRTVKGRWNG